MDITTPISLSGILLASTLLTACCQQPQAYRGTQHRAPARAHVQSGGNCHTHNDSKRGSIRHCHAYTNVNHRHNYGNTQQRRAAPAKPQPRNDNYTYPSYYDTKKKGYYRGDVGSVIDPYAKDVLRDYREF